MNLKTAIGHDDLDAAEEALRRRRKRFKRQVTNAMNSLGARSVVLMYDDHAEFIGNPAYLALLLAGQQEELDRRFLRDLDIAMGSSPLLDKPEGS